MRELVPETAVLAAPGTGPAAAPASAAPSRSRRCTGRRRGARAGGGRGEREAAQALGTVLDDAWVLIKGYKNPRGEIDYLLPGPGGLFAVEVKYVNATFTIARDGFGTVRDVA